ncbi:indolethylamine N-methyltransferase-like [Ambystoma mexicanum]|uniref:indolethylamine N-methyltransferase-like n=1 Tax=Ambystoma mexicanum TaxID=8296 RepID=UPI0037E70DC1
MASSSAWLEQYHKYYDAATGMPEYYAKDSAFVDDAIKQVLKFTVSATSSGAVKGDIIIQYGINLAVLFPACRYFKEITHVALIETNRQAAKKWANNETGAFDFSEAAQFVCELEGHSETWTEKEEMMRRKMTQFLKCEAEEGRLVLPSLLTKADCILVVHFLEMICPSLDVFCKAVKDMSCQLNIGGHLLLNVLLGGTFIIIGTFKFPLLCLDEERVNRAISEAGLVIEKSKNNPRANTCQYSVTDFTSALCVLARKERDV